MSSYGIERKKWTHHFAAVYFENWNNAIPDFLGCDDGRKHVWGEWGEVDVLCPVVSADRRWVIAKDVRRSDGVCLHAQVHTQ